jgi:hypothetical protein
MLSPREPGGEQPTAPTAPGEEKDRSVRKISGQIAEKPAAAQVGGVPRDKKDENLQSCRFSS